MNGPGRTVTACVPAYKASGFVADTLRSLRAQTYADLEILISVDCSTDDTARICEGLALEDPRIRVHVQPSRLGWLENVNHLLREASGAYVFIAAHDDILHPEYVAALVTALQADPGAALAYSDLAWIDGERRATRRYRAGGFHDPVLRGIAMLFQVGAWWLPYRGILRREALDRCGGLKTSRAGEFSADWPWLLRLSLWGRFIRVPRTLCEKRLLPTSLSKSWAFSVSDWLAVDEACRSAIRTSELARGAKATLLLFSGLCWLRHLIGVAVTRALELARKRWPRPVRPTRRD